MAKKKVTGGSSLFKETETIPAVPKAPPKAPPQRGDAIILDQPGRFQMVHKGLLNIDHEYQRTNINNRVIERIVNEFSWVQFGTILVAERPNKLLYVFEGQHRTIGVRQIDSIEEVPCMIYQSSGRSSEAMYFLAIQKNRTKLTALDNFQAMVTGGDAIALAVRDMIEESGYKISSGKTAKTVGIVNDIYKMMKSNAESTRRAWRSCVRLFGGNPITRKPFQGFCRLDEHLQHSEFRSIDSQPIADWIGQLTVMAINDMIEMKKKAFNKTGPTVYAEAIIELLNSKRRKKIESLYTTIVGSQFKDAV